MATTQENTALTNLHISIAGQLVVNAANCDLIMYAAFKVFSGCSGKIASAIYFSTETIHTKKNIIGRLMNVTADDAEKAIVERIIAGAEKASAQRNELSHALIHWDGTQLTRVNPRHQGQGKKPLTKSYLDGLLKESSRGHVAALRAYQELCQKRGIPPSITHE